MIPYLATMGCSVLLFYFWGNRSFQNRKKAVGCGILIAALFLPCVLAGARDEGVGLDTLGYGRLIFHAIKENDGLLNCWSVVEAGGYDIAPLFFLQAFAVIKLSGSQFLYYFVIQLLTITPFFLAIKRIASKDKVWLGMAAYYLIIYMLSLSAMRQCVALGFMTLSVVCFIDRDYTKSIVLFAAAILMHSSVIICSVIYLGWTCLIKYENDVPVFRRGSKIALLAIGFVLCAVWLNIDQVLQFLASMPLLSEYSKYLFNATTTNYKSFFVFFGGMSAVLCLTIRSGSADKRTRMGFWAILALLSIPVYGLQTINEQFIRLSYSFWPFYIIGFADQVSCNTGRKSQFINICSAAFLIFAAGQFVWTYWFNNFFKFLPYTSLLLGIVA